MSQIAILGSGAVSPAGWGVPALRDALAKAKPLPSQPLARPGWMNSLQVCRVPRPDFRPAFLAEARLRRASPLSHFAIGAALEALGPDNTLVQAGELRLGLVFAVMSGCINYSRRFYEETVRDPSTASPLVFPETVFNAPASHLSSLLGSGALSYSLVGDQGMFLVGVSIASHWLREGRIDAALVVGAEETDWLSAEACCALQRTITLSEGAGALYLRLDSSGANVHLDAVTDAHSYLHTRSRREAAAAMRLQLTANPSLDLLCDSRPGVRRNDRAEALAWADWCGPRLSPKLVLGDGLAAGSAWQCVAAVDALRQQRCPRACISVMGLNQQAIGATFVRPDTPVR